MRFSMIIPCYNERDNLDHLLQQITPLQKRYDLEYVLVENGSKDDSAAYFADHIEGKIANVQVVYVPVNRGYGYGIQQGLKVATGDYWGWMHADLQVKPDNLVPFLDFAQAHPHQAWFLQGHRTKRGPVDQLFMHGESLFCTMVFQTRLFDVPAMPILFERGLLDGVAIDAMPDDFSIDIYVHVLARKRGFPEQREMVQVLDRENGQSAWNRGLESRIRQSVKIMQDCFAIRSGRKVTA